MRNSQSETVLKALRKVLHVDAFVRLRLALAPEQQPLLRMRSFLAVQRAQSEHKSHEERERTNLMSAMEKRKTRLQIMPRMSLRLPSTMSSVDMSSELQHGLRNRRQQHTFRSDVGQMNAHFFDPLECLLRIFKLLNAMVGFPVESTKGLFCEDLLQSRVRR
jgi:chromosome condensin MukBEF ATPase and DNA-binding subunit MukB